MSFYSTQNRKINYFLLTQTKEINEYGWMRIEYKIYFILTVRDLFCITSMSIADSIKQDVNDNLQISTKPTLSLPFFTLFLVILCILSYPLLTYLIQFSDFWLDLPFTITQFKCPTQSLFKNEPNLNHKSWIYLCSNSSNNNNYPNDLSFRSNQPYVYSVNLEQPLACLEKDSSGSGYMTLGLGICLQNKLRWKWVESYFTLGCFWWKGWVPLTNVHSSRMGIKIRFSQPILHAPTTTHHPTNQAAVPDRTRRRKGRRRLSPLTKLNPSS